MKRMIAIVLVLLICASFFGCTRESEKIITPVNFYYRQTEIGYGRSDGVIGVCISEGDGYEEDMLGLLNVYLSNTDDPAFTRTFPDGSRLLRLTVLDGIAQVQVNNSFARASGIELTIACASLSLTVMDLTQAETVIISAVNTSLDGAESITMTADSIVLLDLYDIEPET